MKNRRLACFVALAEELHFRRAAERCHMTQPALSQHIRLLEEELQVQLVHRNNRNVALTPAGEALAEGARQNLKQLEQIAQVVKRTARGEVGRLIIGSTAPAMFIALPEIIRQFNKQLPDVGLMVHEMNTAEQLEALRRGAIQLGLVHPPVSDDSILCRQIAEMPYKLAMSDTNPLARKRKLKLKDLASENFIIFPRKVGPLLYDRILSLCQDAGFSPKIVHEAHPAQTLIALAAADFGVGWIASIHQQFPRPGVVYRDIIGPAPKLTIGVVYNNGDTSPAIEKFLAIATKVGDSLV
jgi:DNA-binding transcriptional LysR family regulator